MTGRTRREQAVQIAGELFDIVSVERFASAPRTSIDHAVALARSLKPYFSGQTADVDLLIDYLQQITRQAPTRGSSALEYHNVTDHHCAQSGLPLGRPPTAIGIVNCP